MRDTVRDADAIVDRTGVAPASIPDWLALLGDSADGFPGLPGFGAKTAAKLLIRLGRTEDIPVDPANWGDGIRRVARLADTLAVQARRPGCSRPWRPW